MRRCTKSLTSLVLLSVLTITLSACQVTLESVCNGQYQKYDEKISNAVLALSAWDHPGQPRIRGRRIASVMEMAPLDRSAWQEWAQERLKESQHMADVLESNQKYAKARKNIQEACDTLVAIHGYATKGDAHRMVASLNQVRQKTQKAYELACEGNKSK